MINKRDKRVIDHWLRLYNRLTGSTFQVVDWPDDDSTRKNIDAMCGDEDGRTLAVEHTLIQPFEGAKEDDARFLQTLGSLENHPDLVERGYAFQVRQAVRAIPTGIDWREVPREALKQLRSILPPLPESDVEVVIKGTTWELPLSVTKVRSSAADDGTFGTGRFWPGDPGAELVLRALRNKVPKLSTSSADLKILLMEKDTVAGTVEHQFEQLPDNAEVRALLSAIDQVWSVNTVSLETESVIFTNQVMPLIWDHSNSCSLNVETDDFWRVTR